MNDRRTDRRTDGRTDRSTEWLKAEIAEALGEPAEATAGPHPDIDELAAYREGQLGEAEAQRVEDHLAACPACVETWLELGSFLHPELPDRDGASDLEAARAWRSLNASLPRSRRWSPPATLAASLFVAALSLGGWAAHQHGEIRGLEEQIAALRQPQAEARVVTLRPSSTVRSAGSGEDLDVPSDAPVTLVLEFRALKLSRYHVEILSAEGTRAWAAEVPVRIPYRLYLGLPPSSLAPGEYRIEIYPPDAEGAAPLETFPLHLAPPAHAS